MYEILKFISKQHHDKRYQIPKNNITIPSNERCMKYLNSSLNNIMIRDIKYLKITSRQFFNKHPHMTKGV